MYIEEKRNANKYERGREIIYREWKREREREREKFENKRKNKN